MFNILNTKTTSKTNITGTDTTGAIDEAIQYLRGARINTLFFEEPDGYNFSQAFVSTAQENSGSFIARWFR